MVPEVLTSYRDYAPSVDVAPTVTLLLRFVPPQHLVGIRFIELTNSQSTRMLRRGKTWSRGRKVPMSDCLGFYCGDHIQLLVDRILAMPPSWFLKAPILRAMTVGSVLYHEIGHHVHRTQRPEHREQEDVADQWKKRLMRGFLRKRYWYLRPLSGPFAWAVRAYVRWRYDVDVGHKEEVA